MNSTHQIAINNNTNIINNAMKEISSTLTLTEKSQNQQIGGTKINGKNPTMNQNLVDQNKKRILTMLNNKLNNKNNNHLKENNNTAANMT